MNCCNVNKLNFCHVSAETWTPRVLTFSDPENEVDITGDDFEYIVKNTLSGKEKVFTIDEGLELLQNDKVIISDPELPIGTYFHRLIWTRDDKKVIVFEGTLTVQRYGSEGCGSNSCETNFTIQDCEESIEVTVDERILNIRGATIEVGETNTVGPDEPAKVSNSGTNKDVILDFDIPQGNKGDKGDAFKYEDFTPEQIEELQEPAREAADTANTAAQNADAATNNANEAAGIANNAAQNANDAASNANTAADTANTAAQNADDKIQELTETVYNMMWYGIEWDVTNSSPDVTRIGDLALHRTLPLQSRMVGALVGDDRKVVEYLSPNDWDAHDLTGARGQVMVRIPEHYYKFETDGNIRRAKISEYPLPGFHHFKSVWHGAYEASTYRPDNKLASVANASPDYRGGNNNDSNDEAPSSLLGMPQTVTSRIDFTIAARNRGADWNQVWYEVRKQLFWLFAIEYATFHSQKAVNTELDGNGFRQGGLGDGITTVASANWSSFNDSYPFVPCGTSNELGNRSGEVAFELPEEFEGTTRVVYANRYRGIENPFGHIYEWVEGVNIQIQADDEGDGVSRLWVCDDPDNFQDDNYDGYEMRGLLPRKDGYIQEVLFGEKGDILSSVTGGGSTTYFTDRFYTSIPESGESLRGLLSGGHAYSGVNAGLVLSNLSSAPTSSYASAYRGSRLCCIENVSESD